HARIATTIEQHLPETVQTQPELLAHHYMEAGLAEPAIDYWLKAGQAEIARSATAEAITQLTKGLELISALSDDAARWRRELELQVALGVALMAARGWAAPEVGRANARARDLCERLGDTSRLFPVLYGEWVFHVVRAELEAGRSAGEDLLRRAQEQNDAAAEAIGNRIVGTAELLRGELVAARAHLERTLALYDRAAHRSLAFLFAQDPSVAGLSVLSWGLFALGYPEQAQARSEEALRDATELSHRNTLGYALLYACILSQLRQNHDEARDRANALIALAAEQDSPHFLGAGIIIRGWTLAEAGDFAAGIARIREGLTMWQDTGAGFLVPYFRSLLAEVHGRSGAVNEGLDLITEAIDRVEKTGERWFEAELHRIRGELMLWLPRPDPTGAEAQFAHAVATAHQQGAKLWELRAATCLARLWIEQRRRGEAHDLLSLLYGQFAEGFETPDLRAARAVLQEITASSEKNPIPGPSS
ncbi:adenylate cyclase, partial [Bradyrhizobium genosp. SA-3]